MILTDEFIPEMLKQLEETSADDCYYYDDNPYAAKDDVRWLLALVKKLQQEKDEKR